MSIGPFPLQQHNSFSLFFKNRGISGCVQSCARNKRWRRRRPNCAVLPTELFEVFYEEGLTYLIVLFGYEPFSISGI